jgi:ABC-type phosphate transport system permease subunit
MPVTLVAHDRPTSRFAWNALLGAVLAHPASRGVAVELARSPGDVVRLAAAALAAGSTPVVGWSFFTGRVWDPIAGQFGALPFVYGTVVTSVVALAISIPLGLGAAIFLSELAPPRISDALTFVVELLAAVPSVILGLLGIFVVVPNLRTTVEPALQNVLGFLPLFQGPMYGVGFLGAGVVLAIMTLPFIISISREALLSVPDHQREGALAVGATRWEATWQVVVPYARLGIAGSVFSIGLLNAATLPPVTWYWVLGWPMRSSTRRGTTSGASVPTHVLMPNARAWAKASANSAPARSNSALQSASSLGMGSSERTTSLP